MKCINTIITGHALDGCRYRETTTRENTKTILQGAFEQQLSH